MKKKFILEGLDCANCAAKIEREINNLDGVKNANVNFMTTKMLIEAEDDKISAVLENAEKIIKKIESHVIIKKA
jgi:copper chaperone CopZ